RAARAAHARADPLQHEQHRPRGAPLLLRGPGCPGGAARRSAADDPWNDAQWRRGTDRGGGPARHWADGRRRRAAHPARTPREAAHRARTRFPGARRNPAGQGNRSPRRARESDDQIEVMRARLASTGFGDTILISELRLVSPKLAAATRPGSHEAGDAVLL